ncbi:molybdopterin cofactor-binding domain-containing protein [Streptomyces sp. NPDC023838]|uniref:molybdopterin cofactor-binding domain-containing protein n=1 Tax=Streptomyces sp. NPDC023838 TaxID=3154325 RepID=UPI0033D8978D
MARLTPAGCGGSAVGFLRPRDLTEALELRRHHPGAWPVAGGTIVMPKLNTEGERPAALFCAHRVVVDVDSELGRVRVVDLAMVQDVGRVLKNRIEAEGQLHGGTVQGVGLALSEELAARDGVILNPGFGEYVMPAATDVPSMQVVLLESADDEAPYGLRGVDEVSAVSSTPAVAAAVRDATGRALMRVPIRPWDLVP